MNYFVFQSLLVTALLIYTWQRTIRAELPFRISWNLAFLVMVAGFIGGRLFHVFYEYPELYKEDWTRVLRFWEGGFVYDGGFVLALLVCFFYLNREKENFLVWADFYSPIMALGYAFGRIGCLIAGCCYGSYCDAPWSLDGRHPTQLYAFATEMLLYGYLLQKEKERHPPGLIFSIWLIGHALGRLLMESYRADFRGAALGGFSVSSWTALFVFSSGLGLYMSLTAKKR